MSSPNPNPYAPPTAPIPPGAYGVTGPGACPRCKSPMLHRPTFTWWGGALGPKLFHHTVCRACGFGFNAKTGKSNATAIGMYVGAGFLLAIAIVVVRAMM